MQNPRAPEGGRAQEDSGPSRAPCCDEIRGVMAVPFFKALCDPNRVAILAHLAADGAPRTVSDVAARLPIDVSVVSRHLSMLRNAGILTAERRGKAVYYAVHYAALAGTLRAMAETIEACCPPEAAAGAPAAARPTTKEIPCG